MPKKQKPARIRKNKKTPGDGFTRPLPSNRMRPSGNNAVTAVRRRPKNQKTTSTFASDIFHLSGNPREPRFLQRASTLVHLALRDCPGRFDIHFMLIFVAHHRRFLHVRFDTHNQALSRSEPSSIFLRGTRRDEGFLVQSRIDMATKDIAIGDFRR